MHNVENWPNILKTYIQILRCSKFLKYIRSFFNIIVGSSYKSAALLKGRDFKIFSWFAKIFNLKFTFQIQYWVLNDSEPLHCKMESTKKFTNAWQPDTKMTWKFFKNNAWQQIRIEETIIAGIMLNNSWCFNFFYLELHSGYHFELHHYFQWVSESYFQRGHRYYTASRGWKIAGRIADFC